MIPRASVMLATVPLTAYQQRGLLAKPPLVCVYGSQKPMDSVGSI